MGSDHFTTVRSDRNGQILISGKNTPTLIIYDASWSLLDNNTLMSHLSDLEGRLPVVHVGGTVAVRALGS